MPPPAAQVREFERNIPLFLAFTLLSSVRSIRRLYLVDLTSMTVVWKHEVKVRDMVYNGSASWSDRYLFMVPLPTSNGPDQAADIIVVNVEKGAVTLRIPVEDYYKCDIIAENLEDRLLFVTKR